MTQIARSTVPACLCNIKSVLQEEILQDRSGQPAVPKTLVSKEKSSKAMVGAFLSGSMMPKLSEERFVACGMRLGEIEMKLMRNANVM